ncbi:MAG: 50S ribosomal protein L35 [Candidatus Magasanikbacteria bacterium]
MPKIKTHKATAKRFRVKKSRSGTKILKRTDGQDHFNARQSGKKKRNKRSDNTLANTAAGKTIIRSVPYS